MQASNKSHSYMSVHTLVCQEMFHLRTITTFIANVWPNLDAPRGNKYYLDRQDINKLLPSFLHPFLFNYRRKTIKGEHLFSSSYLYIYIYLSIFKSKYFLRRIIQSRCYERSENKAKQLLSIQNADKEDRARQKYRYFEEQWGFIDRDAWNNELIDNRFDRTLCFDNAIITRSRNFNYSLFSFFFFLFSSLFQLFSPFLYFLSP